MMNRYNTKEGWKLIDSLNKKELKIGDPVVTFRNEEAEVIALNPPHKQSSQGKVGIRFLEEQDGAERTMEVYASVVGARYEYHGGETQ